MLVSTVCSSWERTGAYLTFSFSTVLAQDMWVDSKGKQGWPPLAGGGADSGQPRLLHEAHSPPSCQALGKIPVSRSPYSSPVTEAPFDPHFTEKETEVQREQITDPRLSSQAMVVMRFELQSPGWLKRSHP